jgi:hypothetical protein
MDLANEFRILNQSFKDNRFNQIFGHKLGTYFLKMRSISRVPLLRELADRLQINVSTVKGSNRLFQFMFCQEIPIDVIDRFTSELYQEERSKRLKNEDHLYSQLYKLKVFDWGGFHQNAVERTIVNNYVKTIQSYDELCEKIENDINPRIKGYVLCSWYNHWASVLIEDMFKDHQDVLPTVGKVEKIDFFWRDFPFDLKTTYFPDGFMQIKRKELGLIRKELTELKRFAREHKIYYDRKAKDREVFTELITRISEDTSREAREFIANLHKVRRKIILEAMDSPQDLIRWLYEEQGPRRFDAANRFFLILVDLKSLEESLKLKRNKNLLKERINSYLDENKDINLEKLKIQFNWKEENREYTVYATTLFIVK